MTNNGMRYVSLALAMTFVMSALMACRSAKGPVVQPAPQGNLVVPASAQDLAALAQGNLSFASKLYEQLAKEENLFFSPYSLRTALAMSYLGARGATAEELSAALDLRLTPEQVPPAFKALQDQVHPTTGKGHTLRQANALWAEQTYAFLPEFLRVTREGFSAPVQNLDFMRQAEPARKTINDWVAKQTEQRIKDLIPPGAIDKDTLLVLTNAVYFLGQWQHPFAKHLTRQHDFHAPSGKIKVPMMQLTKPVMVKYYQDELMQAIELPYQGGEVSMMLWLPRSDASFKGLELSLAQGQLKNLLASMADSPEELTEVSMPKFKLTWGTKDVKAAMQAMGVRLAFDGGDFSGMDGSQNLAIAAVFHKAFVDVYEEGTEAAAATGIGMTTTGFAEPKHRFHANRPFVFIIHHKASGQVLFMGKLLNPLLGS